MSGSVTLARDTASTGVNVWTLRADMLHLSPHPYHSLVDGHWLCGYATEDAALAGHAVMVAP